MWKALTELCPLCSGICMNINITEQYKIVDIGKRLICKTSSNNIKESY